MFCDIQILHEGVDACGVLAKLLLLLLLLNHGKVKHWGVEAVTFQICRFVCLK